jgi:hypothetical protein
VKDGLAVVDVALGGERDDYVLIEERGVVGGSFHETAAREIFHGPGPTNCSRGVVAKASRRRSFLEALAAEVTSFAKKTRWDSADSIYIG